MAALVPVRAARPGNADVNDARPTASRCGRCCCSARRLWRSVWRASPRDVARDGSPAGSSGRRWSALFLVVDRRPHAIGPAAQRVRPRSPEVDLPDAGRADGARRWRTCTCRCSASGWPTWSRWRRVSSASRLAVGWTISEIASASLTARAMIVRVGRRRAAGDGGRVGRWLR